ncbi:MAG: FliG C-terminal domain-containing protein, partial [Bdellovibrionota bacterium]
PGFDDLIVGGETRLAASGATVRLLMDEKVGPVTRAKLMEFIQQYLDTLDFPVKVSTHMVRFPQASGSTAKVSELRDRIAKQYKTAIDDLFASFCPKQCMLTDFDVKVEQVNVEEAQYGSPGEYLVEGGTGIRIKSIVSTILLDQSLSEDERKNILEMAKLKTSSLKNVEIASKTIKFPRPKYELQDENGEFVYGPGGTRKLSSSNSKSDINSSSTQKSLEQADKKSTESKDSLATSKSTSAETNARQERFERIEKIERVESGDAVQKELDKFKVYGLFFSSAVLAMLVFITLSIFRVKSGGGCSTIHKVIQSLTNDPAGGFSVAGAAGTGENQKRVDLAKRYEIEQLTERLMTVFAQNPRVAKYVFTRILTEEGVEVTGKYLHIFGESVVIDMLRDPSLQTDLNELMEYYAKNPMELEDDEKLELLRRLHHRTVAGKLSVLGSRSSTQFEFLVEMDGLQILELIRTESITVKAIILTQCDAQKRSAVFAQLDEDTRMKLLNELSRIDYLPRDYISNVANALKRKRKENPKLNTEALPGSEVLVSLLERTGPEVQKSVVKMLEVSSPDSARLVKNKLVSIDTLRHLRDNQLLEIVLSLKHEELLQFLKGSARDIKEAIYQKSPKDLVAELEEELTQVGTPSREIYQAIERRVLNRMKIMANEGVINLIETNERMLSEARAGGGSGQDSSLSPPASVNDGNEKQTGAEMKKVAGW